MLSTLPPADWLLADRGYDADWFREALLDRGTKPCIPGRKSRDRPIKHDKRRYKRRHRIEMMFGRLKDGRRGATCYDRCPIVFPSAIALRGRCQRSGLEGMLPGRFLRRPSTRSRLGRRRGPSRWSRRSR